MIDFFMKEKCDLYRKVITNVGAGDSVVWQKAGTIKAYVEPVDGEKLIGTNLGDKDKITVIVYTQSLINEGERLIISSESPANNWYEIRGREFYRLPFFNYYKGYLVKTDENL